MNMADAIRSSKSESAVHFLLTSYLENLNRSESSFHLPRPITRLPLSGDGDVHDRMLALIKELLEPSGNLDDIDSSALIDALRVFGAAVYRLTLPDSREFGGPRSDNRARTQPPL